MELLKSHRSIRKFQPVQIPEDILLDILESGVQGSNTGNMQLYSIIITRDVTKKNALSPLHFNQSMVNEATVFLTICFDFNRFLKWCNQNNTTTDFFNLLWVLNGTIDASILAQNICIAAEFHQLGICYLGTALYNAPEISKVLNLPTGVIPITAIAMGYPAIKPEKTDRLDLRAIVHLEEYHDYSSEIIDELYFDKENLQSSKEFVAVNKKKNLAQVYAEVRYKSSDNVLFSEKIRNMLINQGFRI